MRLLLKLAWRNIWRNKRRSILTLLAIAFATMSAVAMRGIQLGTYSVNIKNAVELFTGYIQIQRKGYQSNPSLKLCFKPDNSLLNSLKSTSEITGYSPRIYASGLVSFKENSFGTSIIGINPEGEKSTTRILGRIHEGEFFTNDSSSGIVLGYKLLDNLQANIGDEVIILSQGFDGSLGNRKFKIMGTTKLGSTELDGMASFIGIKTAQELLSTYGNIHSIAITLNELDNIDPVKNQINAQLDTTRLAALAWDEVMPDFKQSIEFDNVTGLFFLFILILIVAFGILNTILMSVTERFNEFGVNLSLGMPQIKLVYLIFIETVFITILGLIIGNILGWGINYYILLNPIEFSGELGMIYEEYGFLPRIESTLRFSIFLNISLSVMTVSLFAALYPAYKVYRLEPLKGIRYT